MSAILRAEALPPVIPAIDWGAKLPDDVGMMRNDQIGDCTCAGVGHLVQTWTSITGAEVTISDDDIVAAYSAITGYTPDDPSTDQGAVLLDVLNYWRNTGIGGHKIGAYALVDHTNVVEVQTAMFLFGGLYTGAQLPMSAQSSIGTLWSEVAAGGTDRGSWGGHCLAAVAYNPYGITYLTWGARQLATWAWENAYADEMYAIVSKDWVDGTKPAPSGFDLPKLQEYLGALAA